jgi:hypothetical protein
MEHFICTQLIVLPCCGLFSVRKLELNVYDYYHENWIVVVIVIIIIIIIIQGTHGGIVG